LQPYGKDKVMKKIRAVLSGIAAIAAIGTFYVFSASIVTDVSNAEIPEEYIYSRGEETDALPDETPPDVGAVFAENDISVPDSYSGRSPEVEIYAMREIAELPTNEEYEAVSGIVAKDNYYEALPAGESIDFLNITPLNDRPVFSESVPVVTEVPVDEPDNYLPETVVPFEEITDSVEDMEAAEAEQPSNKRQLRMLVPSFDEINDSVESHMSEASEIAASEEATATTTVYRPNDLVLYQDSNMGGGYYEVQYVNYNFDTMSRIPLWEPAAQTETSAPAEQAQAPSTDENGEIIFEEPSMPTIEEAASAPVQRSGYLLPSAYTGQEVFTANFDGMKQECDAYTLVCMICSIEVSPSFSYESIKAQAVCAYTYLKYHNVNGIIPSCVVKYNVPETIKSAVDEVFGQCVYYDGKVAQTLYTASTAGSTASAVNVWGGANFPYLTYVELPIDQMYDPNWGVVVQYTKDEMKGYLERYCGITLSDDPSNWIKIQSYHDGKYVKEIYIDDQVSVTGKQFKEGVLHYQIKSWAFDISYADEIFTITTYGYGHGVGLSQNGANILGRQGYTYDQIVATYFPGTYIQ
jgi:stage II sporulation protein D